MPALELILASSVSVVALAKKVTKPKMLDDSERTLIIYDVKKTCYSNSVKNITMLTTKIKCKNNALTN